MHILIWARSPTRALARTRTRIARTRACMHSRTRNAHAHAQAQAHARAHAHPHQDRHLYALGSKGRRETHLERAASGTDEARRRPGMEQGATPTQNRHAAGGDKESIVSGASIRAAGWRGPCGGQQREQPWRVCVVCVRRRRAGTAGVAAERTAKCYIYIYSQLVAVDM